MFKLATEVPFEFHEPPSQSSKFPNLPAVRSHSRHDTKKSPVQREDKKSPVGIYQEKLDTVSAWTRHVSISLSLSLSLGGLFPNN